MPRNNASTATFSYSTADDIACGVVERIGSPRRTASFTVTSACNTSSSCRSRRLRRLHLVGTVRVLSLNVSTTGLSSVPALGLCRSKVRLVLHGEGHDGRSLGVRQHQRRHHAEKCNVQPQTSRRVPGARKNSHCSNNGDNDKVMKIIAWWAHNRGVGWILQWTGVLVARASVFNPARKAVVGASSYFTRPSCTTDRYELTGDSVEFQKESNHVDTALS